MDLRQEIREHKVRTLKTVVVSLLFVGLGIYGATPGVTMLDLGILTNTTTAQVAQILPARAGGYAIGALISSFITHFFDHQICLMSSLVISIATFAALPYFKSIKVMYSIIFWAGVSAGCIDTVGNVYTVYLWGRKAAPFIQAVHFAFGLGAFISPMIANPFLLEATEEIAEFGRDLSQQYPDFKNLSFESITGLQHDHQTHDPKRSEFTADQLKVHWAYIIISIFNLCVLIFFIIVYCFRPVTKAYPTGQTDKSIQYSGEKLPPPYSTVEKIDEKKKPIDNETCIRSERSIELEKSEKFNQSNSSDKNLEPFHEFTLTEPLGLAMKLVVIILTVIFFHLYCGLEISFGSLLAPFAVKSNLRMTKSEGSFITSVYWGMFTFIRIFGLFAITYFSPRAMLIFNMALIMLSNVFLLPLANTYRWALWVGSGLMGLGCSSIFATMFSFVQQLTPLTPIFTSIIMISCCLGEFIIPFVVGIWIDTNPEVFLYITFIYSMLSFLILVVLFLIQHHLLKIQKLKSDRLH